MEHNFPPQYTCRIVKKFPSDFDIFWESMLTNPLCIQ